MTVRIQTRITGVLVLLLSVLPSWAGGPEGLFLEAREGFTVALAKARRTAAQNAQAAKGAPAPKPALQAAQSAPEGGPVEDAGVVVAELKDGQAPAAKPRYAFKLAELDNKVVSTAFRFSSPGPEVTVAGGLDPADADSAYLVFRAGDFPVVFNMRTVLGSPNKPPRVNFAGRRVAVFSTAVLLDKTQSEFRLHDYEMKKDEKGKEKMEVGAEIVKFTIQQIMESAHAAAAPATLSGEGFRLAYGDAVRKGAERPELGGKILAFSAKAKDGKYRVVMVDAAQLKPGRFVWTALSDKAEAGLALGADGTLSIYSKEDSR